jgi:O-antigen/teichoic acid export membrane protein
VSTGGRKVVGDRFDELRVSGAIRSVDEPDAGVAGEPAPLVRTSGLPRRLGANVIANYTATALAGIAALVTTPILLRYLGTTQYGVWVLLGSAVAYLELFELGFSTTTTKLVAEDAGRRPDSVVRTLNTNVAVLAVFGVLAIVLGLSIATRVPLWFHVAPDLRSAARDAFVIMTVAIAISIPLDALGGALNAYQRVDLVSLSNAVRALGAAAGGAAAAVLGGGIVAVTVAGASFGIGVHYLRWRMLKRMIPRLRLSPKLIERDRLRRTAHLSAWFMIRDTTAVIIDRMDLVVVGVILGVKAAAVYAVGLKLAQVTLRALLPFTQLFFPRASGLSAVDDREGLSALLVDGTRVTLTVAMPITLVLCLLAQPAIRAWVGDGFHGAVWVLILLALARGLGAITETSWWLLGGAGWIRWTSSLSLVEAAVNLGTSIVLARAIGPAGVAAGTLIGVVVSRLPVAFVLSRKATGLPTAAFARHALLPHLLPVLLTAGFLVGIGRVLPPSPVPVLALAAGAFLIYIGSYLRFGATPAESARARALVGQLASHA